MMVLLFRTRVSVFFTCSSPCSLLHELSVFARALVRSGRDAPPRVPGSDRSTHRARGRAPRAANTRRLGPSGRTLTKPASCKIRRWRETPDWWMSTRSTMSLTACSPPRSDSTMRKRMGSARIWKTAACMMMHMHTRAYHCCQGGRYDDRAGANFRLAPRSPTSDLRLVVWPRAARASRTNAKSCSTAFCPRSVTSLFAGPLRSHRLADRTLTLRPRFSCAWCWGCGGSCSVSPMRSRRPAW